ncbi:hypothetical protein A2U01_0078114 [Trifolium medium]|uniref:Uncharacterized protein n=1 Tax=Trifolium medium TaxID=97028 RepID=A0A392T6X8_9FABA|nr:hypothetical protein [Trifolium medium]
MWLEHQCDSAILQPSSVPEYGRNRFSVGAARIAVKTRMTGEIAVLKRSSKSPENSDYRGRVCDPVLENTRF